MPPTSKLPGVVLTAGVLSLGYGAILMMCCALGAGQTWFSFSLDPQQAGIEGIERALAKEVPSYLPMQIGLHAINFLLAVGLILSGIGALRLMPAARWVGSLCALADMLAGLILGLYTVIAVVPVADRIVAAEMKNMPPMPFDVGKLTTVSIWGNLCFSLILSWAFCIPILITFNVKTARDAFAGKLPPPLTDDDPLPPDDDDGDGDDYRRPPRPPGNTGIKTQRG